MDNRTYVVGHVNPDTDSIASAIGYAWLLWERDEIDALPARAGATNPQTNWVLKRLGINAPSLLTDASPRFLNVLEVNMLTQDLLVVCPPQYGRQLLDSVLRHHGVAHFLFHPAHILKAGVADTLSDLVEYGRTQGIEWWTNEQIYEWEMRRRSVETALLASNRFTFRAAKPLPEATLLFLKPRPEPRAILLNDQPARSVSQSLHGFEFDAVTVDLAGEIRVKIG